MKTVFKCHLVITLVLASGCSVANRSDNYTAGDISGINHTAVAINYFSVNGYGGPNIFPFGDGGGYCCVMLPKKWHPGLKARINWEITPDTVPPPPPYSEHIKFRAWSKNLKASYIQHETIVDIPQYGTERCGITVHFLPCNQIKVTTVCQGYGTPDYPIKEPRHMEEPATCPVK
ncbi:DUF3304 domain-containing protein [Salmonella enterica]|nr:DUF3304 domain-containing protein [Salmonella enterica]